MFNESITIKKRHNTINTKKSSSEVTKWPTVLDSSKWISRIALSNKSSKIYVLFTNLFLFDFFVIAFGSCEIFNSPMFRFIREFLSLSFNKLSETDLALKSKLSVDKSFYWHDSKTTQVFIKLLEEEHNGFAETEVQEIRELANVKE